MGYVPMHMPIVAAQGGEPPSRPARPPRVPSGRLESIPEQGQVELGPSSQQQDRPLPGIGFVTATMGQGPPPQGYVPPDLADAMAARARQVLRAVPPRQRVDPDSPTTRLTDFLQNGGAARVASLEVMIRPPGDGPLYVEVADRNGGSAAESSSPPSSPERPAVASSGGGGSSKRRRAVTAPFRRRRRAKTAASMVEEELLRKVELHREQLAGALAWLAHAVAERDYYSREKARLYDILERDRALYEEAVNTAPAASPPGSPKAGPAAVTTAAAAASPEPPSPAAAAPAAADDAWREWKRASHLKWADASSPPAPPQRNHRRPLPSAPATAGSPIAAATPTASDLSALHPLDRPPPPPRDPRTTVTAAAAADKPPRHKAGMPKFRYAYGGSTAQRRQQLESHLAAHTHQDEEARRRCRSMLPPPPLTRPAATSSPLRHEVAAAPTQDGGLLRRGGEVEAQGGDVGQPGCVGPTEGAAKLPSLLPPFDGPWGNTGLNPILLAPDRRLLHAPF